MSGPDLFFVAGETSGDVRAGEVARHIKDLHPPVSMTGAGGDRMQEAGVRVIRNTAEHGVVGIWEVFDEFLYFAESYRKLLSEIRQRNPDAVVLVDFPEFNLKLAEQLQREQHTVLYYISPQIWAWRKGRIKKIRRVVDRMIVLFPFEKNLYKSHGVPVDWVGHPLVDEIPPPGEDEEPESSFSSIQKEDTTLGILPGSRRKEFERHFPPMRKAVQKLRRTHSIDHVLIPVSPDLSYPELVHTFDPDQHGEQWFHGRAREVIRACDVLMTASGTTTLEAALLETPMVVAYRVNALTWLTGRLLVEVDHIGLVNIVAGEEIVPELVQWNLTPDRLADCTANLLAEGPEGNTVQKLRTVREKLGPPGAARRAAQSILKSTGVNVADNESLSSRYRNHL